MSSLTPGTLSTLLQNLDTPTTTGHRLPLLQVIAILPSLTFSDPLRTNAFYLRVSDSLHSAYVSVPDNETELILSDEIQLGQFIYLSRLDPGSPVPVIRGIKVVKKRRGACVGEPKDLISSEVLLLNNNNNKGKGKRENVKSLFSLRRVSLGNNDGNEGLERRRLSLDSAARRGWDRSPVVRNGGSRCSFDSASVLSSKKASSEKNLILRRPKSSSSSNQKLPTIRKSFSDKDFVFKQPPSPRISTHKPVISNKAYTEKDSILKHPISSSISPLKQVHLGRKSSSEKASTPKLKHPSSSSSLLKHVRNDIKSSSEKVSTPKHPTSSVSPLKIKNVIDSPRLLSKPITKELKQSTGGTVPSRLIKVPLCFKTWSDAKMLWDLLPSTIHDLGKEVMSTRNARFLAAVYALQVASATEGILQCMSTFSELCNSSEKNSAFPLVEDFLNLHQSILRAATAINTLLNMKLPEDRNAYYSQYPLSEMCEKIMGKNATSWVQAAVGTNLSKFDLFSKEDNRVNLNGEKCHYVVLENSSKKVEEENNLPDIKRSPRNQEAPISGSRLKMSPYNSRQHLSTTKKTTTAKELQPTENGLSQVASLAAKLLLLSRVWFLNYLDESLNKGFGLQKGEGDSEIASLLGQLKRVNQWLDNSFSEENGTDERIEGLKKKIYGFLLDNVDSAIISR